MWMVRDGRGRLWAFGLASALNLVSTYWPDQPGPDVGLPYADKVVHVLIFAAVAWTGRRAGIGGWLLGVVLLAHAVTSEVVQATLLATRSGDVADVLADLAGIALGLALGGIPIRRATRSERPNARS